MCVCQCPCECLLRLDGTTSQHGELNIEAYPSLFSFTSQIARISTIVFTPADLQSMNVTMKFGEAWIFQCPSSTADRFADSSTLECRVQVTAGDCHVVDLHAAKIIEARTVLGDVKLSFDDDQSEKESRSYGDDSNSTILGDVKIMIGGQDHRHALPATAMREKWMIGTGKDFS